MKEYREKAFALIRTEHNNEVIGIDNYREALVEDMKECHKTKLRREVWGKLKIVPCEIVFTN